MSRRPAATSTPSIVTQVRPRRHKGPLQRLNAVACALSDDPIFTAVLDSLLECLAFFELCDDETLHFPVSGEVVTTNPPT